MMQIRTLTLLALAAILPSTGCVGTTGGDLFTFDGAASGPIDAEAGRPLSFTSGRGYHVTLTRAKVRIGAVYLNKAMPVSGAQETSCILPGVYLAEVTRGIEVDALSPDPQPFPEAGEGIEGRALAAEVWLGGSDPSAIADAPVVLDAAGTAEKGGVAYPFEAEITIGENRALHATDPAQPGAHPICKQRIVSPIPVSFDVRSGGALRVRVDPRGFFANVDFSGLDPDPDDPSLYRFRDETVEQPNVSLYDGLRARVGVYEVTWDE